MTAASLPRQIAGRRPLCVGIGGGGDVAGALVLASAIGYPPAIAGLSWERRALDPSAGPRAICELEAVEPKHRVAALAGPHSRLPGAIPCSEGLMSRFLGRPVGLLDPGEGPAAAADGIVALVGELGCDMVLLLDVGGDALADGSEPGLVSPLADAIMMATTVHLRARGVPTGAAVLGPGCDGELTVSEVQTRLDAIAAADGMWATFELDRARLPRLRAAAAAVGTEATALALRCAAGEEGLGWMRGDRPVQLSRAGGRLHLFSAEVALSVAAPLALAVADATTIEAADARLRDRGVVSELGQPDRRWEPSAIRQRARRAAR